MYHVAQCKNSTGFEISKTISDPIYVNIKCAETSTTVTQGLFPLPYNSTQTVCNNTNATFVLPPFISSNKLCPIDYDYTMVFNQGDNIEDPVFNPMTRLYTVRPKNQTKEGNYSFTLFVVA